jgi:membrane protease YdiL (CAAX protease family)
MTHWKRKLSSRKFWALLAALITSLLTALGASNDTVIQVTGVIGAFGAVIAYILAEAYVDGKSAEATLTDESE